MIEQELDVYLRARCTLLVLVTPEEERALQTVKAVCERGKRACLTWDVADGFHALTPGAGAPAARDPLSALEQVDKADGDVLFVLKDFHECWSNAQIKRKLRGVAQRLKFSKKSIVVLTPAAKLPEELKDEAVVVEFPPPTAAELEAVLARLAKTPGVKVNLTKLGHEKLVQAALGLTAAQAQRVFAKAIVSDGVLDDRDIDRVTEEKKQIIRESEALEFYPVTETAADVGGLGVLKEWLRLRERAFTQEARDYGLPSPKGIALIGIPGTGKSLTAKMIAGLWRLPLLRLDVGALFGSLVGESEERARRALRVAETVSPAVVWVDELEKAMAHGGSDSGTSTRVFGSILTWMQEKQAPAFVVACMTGDTVIAQPDGSLPTLGEAPVGPLLSADFDKGGVVPTQSDLKVSPLARKTVEVCYSGGILCCTPNHPLFVADSKAEVHEVPAGDLKPGDYLAAPLTLPEPSSVLHPLTIPLVAPQARPVELPASLTEDVAHWLGYLTGDGGVARHTADQPQRIQWAELHEGMASFLNTLTQKTFGKGVRIHPRKSAGGFYIYLDSSRIGRWLAANYPEAIRPGGPHRSAAALVCRSPNRVVARYLAGLFDAEGTVGQTRLEFRSTSFVLAQQVTLLLRRLSIQATFGRGRPKTSFTKRPLYRVVVSETSSVVRFAEQIGLGHPAKAERLAALVKRLREKPVRLIGACVLDVPVPANYLDDLLRQHKLPASVLPYYPGRRRPGQTVSRLLFGVWLRVLEELTGQLFPKLRVLLSFRWDRVKAVRALRGAKRVHDLRVPQFHNYVAGGLIVHNTANDISSLPPELLRKGRFDEIFFLDLPTLAERREIFAVHLQKRKRLAQDHDLDRLARESEGYVGAEIEQAIIDAMYAGFGAGREFTSDDVSAALKRQVPLSVSQRETIGALRAWLKEGRAQSASFQEAQEAEQQFVPLDLGNR